MDGYINAQTSDMPFKILLIEDSPADVRLTREALIDAKLIHELFVINDGVEALTFLYQKDEHKDAPRPDIILLDLNLPKKDGREVLEEIKTNDALKSIPIVVLTTSQAEEDILRSYNLHANCYVTKPVDITKFTEIIKSIENFWLTIVKLPSNSL